MKGAKDKVICPDCKSVINSKDVAVGDGSVEFFVRKKIYSNITKPFSYGQTQTAEI